MPLESFAALGVASNIVQFVDFGCRLFSQSKELYRSSNGLADEAGELENITRSLSRLTKNLMLDHSFWNQVSSERPDIEIEDRLDHILPIQPAYAVEENSDQMDLMLIATDCKEVAAELSEALNQLRVKSPGKKWQCFRVALKRIWKPERLNEMIRRMERLSSQLTMCLVNILK